MDDEAAILELHRRWIGLEEAGRGLEVLGLCTPSVEWHVPGRAPLTGLAAVERYLRALEPVPIRSIRTFDVRVAVCATLASKHAAFETTLGPAGAASVVTGTHLWTLHKDASDGNWRVAGLAWELARA